MHKKGYLFLIFLLVSLHNLEAQNDPKIHAHNDYERKLPFWMAYMNGSSSIEADIYLESDTLYVTHRKREIVKNRTLENLYLKPLRQAFLLQLDMEQNIQLLIDIKSDAHKTLGKLLKVLKEYPDLTDNPKVSLVISGNRPAPEEYNRYPHYILFDYQSLDAIPNPVSEKVALISLNFRKYSKWDGQKVLDDEDIEKIKAIITKAHSFDKPFRFWGTPDTELAWKTFAELGVDYLNTGRPAACSNYIKSRHFPDVMRSKQ